VPREEETEGEDRMMSECMERLRADDGRVFQSTESEWEGHQKFGRTEDTTPLRITIQRKKNDRLARVLSSQTQDCLLVTRVTTKCILWRMHNVSFSLAHA